MERNDLIEQYLAHLAHNRGRLAGTVTQYRRHLALLAGFLDGDLLAATDEQLEVFCGPYLHKRGRNARSRRPVVSCVRGFYAWARRKGLTAGNPAQALHQPRAGNPLPVPITLDNAQKLMWAPDLGTLMGLRDAAILGVMLGCGVRVGGLVSLNEGHLLAVTEGGERRLLVRVTEKGGRERRVPVPKEAELLLRAYLMHDGLEGIDRTLPNGDRVLFVSLKNRRVPEQDYHGEARRLTDGGIRKMLRKYGQAAGVPLDQLNPHAMRHLYGTELEESDVDLRVSQRLLGHADAQSTQIYTHLATRKLFKEADRANPLGKVVTPVSELLKRMP